MWDYYFLLSKKAAANYDPSAINFPYSFVPFAFPKNIQPHQEKSKRVRRRTWGDEDEEERGMRKGR